METMGAATPLPLDAVQDVVAASAALHAARHVGLLDRLTVGSATPSDLAAELDLDPPRTVVLLRALATLGLVAVDGPDGRYRAAPGLSEVVERVETAFATLPAALRGAWPGPSADRVAGAAALYPDLVAVLGEALVGPAREAARRLAAPDLEVLDAGAGAAPWSLALLDLEPSCRVTALDLPEVLPETDRAVRAAGQLARVELVAGDLFALPFAEPRFDLVLAANVCHLFDGRSAARLVDGLARTLRRGGTLAVIDVVPDRGGPVGRPRGVALYELGLSLRTRTGRVHDHDAYRGWFETAGLVGVGREQLAAGPLSLVTATRATLGT